MDLDDDIDADIAAAMASAGDAPAPVAAAEPEEILPANTKDEPEPAEAKGDRTRDEHGRFAKADELGQAEQAQTQEPAPPTILPPRSWTAQAKADFASLPPHIQQEVLRREGEIDAGKAQWDTKAEQFNKLDAALSKVRDRYRLAGLSDEAYVSALVNADEMLRGPNSLQAIQMLAQQYGISLPMPGGPQQQPFQAQADPRIEALQQTVQSLQAQQQAAAKAQEDAGVAQAQAQIEAFRNDPAHLYFDNVRDEMKLFLQGGKAKDLGEAYDMACHARPDIRALIAATVPKTVAQVTRPNGASVTGAARGTAKPNGHVDPNSSIEDDIRSSILEVSGR